MQRALYHQLANWKKSKNRKPLLLQGARQVGKTFLLETFAKKEYADCCYVNFEENPRCKDFFKDKLEPRKILQQLSLYLSQEITPEKTLIIFDEIQECPEALTSLKYFCEDAREYHIAGAGSLLGVRLARTKSFPVGKVNFLHLYPLSFFEFLDAMGKQNLKNYLEELDNVVPLSLPIHAQLLELLRLYLFVGGMPEAVKCYSETEQPLEVREIQNEILKAYMHDFAKHAPPHQINKITSVWKSIPAHLAKENKKFIFSAVAKSARAREYESAIQWLLDAGLIHQAFNISKPVFPLQHYAELDVFKIFLCDVGLLGAMCQLSPQILLNQQQILLEFKGALTENFVAQELVARQDQFLCYWSSEGRAEVDFLISKDHHIFPLESKAGISRKKKSLLVYQQKFQPQYLLRASAMNLEKNHDIHNYPLYLISKIPF